ncbi:MAG: IS110 family transposase [Desulfobacterales bacterium]|nr:IS110 family transposase [Desulfobacterales bacterium]
MNNKIAYIGIDYHVNSLTIAIMIEGNKEISDTVRIGNQDKLIKKYLKKMSARYTLRICYEASASGYVFQRKLKQWGYQCDIIAPSLVPKSVGDRRKNDHRDAKNLARHYAHGDLTIVHPPTESEESIRRLVRCRLQFKQIQKKVKQHINSFLLATDMTWTRTRWTQVHIKWLSSLEMKDQYNQEVLDEQVNHLKYLQTRIEHFDDQIEQIAQSDVYRSSVLKLKAFRGIRTLTAMLIITEITDFRRFPNAGSLMAFLGLIPSENTSGDKQKGGGITKTGNRRVRTQLIESVNQCSRKPKISADMEKNLKATDARSARIAVKCMERLHKRYWSLIMKGKERNKVIAAVAREFTGFIWATMTPALQTESS